MERGQTGEEYAIERAVVTVPDAMTRQEARSLSGRRGARLVLLMGERGVGKTALIAALWQRFTEADAMGQHRLAGSRTAFGLERRAHWLRIDSGLNAERFPPTPADDPQLLHLRVRRNDGELVELLLADLAGERFERVREGRPLADELPWVGRVDRFAVLLDACAISRQGQSEIAVTRAQRQILALRSRSLARDAARVALVVTKADTLSRVGEAALRRHEPALLEAARAVDPEATIVHTTALARNTSYRGGLGDLLTWLCADDRPAVQEPLETPEPVRAMAGFRG